MTATVCTCSRVAMLAVGLASLSVLGYATPLCPGWETLAPNTLASIGVGTAGSGVTGACTFLGNVFSNISLAGSSVSGSAPSGAIDPNDVEVQLKLELPHVILFILTDPIAGDWSLTGTQQFTLDLSYTVSGPSWLLSFGDELNADASGGGIVSFDNSAVTGANPPQVLPTLFNSSSPPFNDDLLFPGSPGNPPNTVAITDIIQVQANNGSANLTSATNVLVTPEPMTSMLLGFGLLAIGLKLRRKRK